jgi:membrane-associated phospholipid phosphatase
MYAGQRWMFGLQRAVSSQPEWLQIIEIVLIADLGFYLAHRAMHAVPCLWRLHAIHHSIEDMDWLAGFRAHPLDQSVVKCAGVVPVFLLGFSGNAIGAYFLLYAWQSVFLHSNVRIRFGPGLRWLLASPEFHHWHHSKDYAIRNKNFAGQLPFIDAIFGSAYMPKGRRPTSFGIVEPMRQHCLLQLAMPFLPAKSQLDLKPRQLPSRSPQRQRLSRLFSTVVAKMSYNTEYVPKAFGRPMPASINRSLKLSHDLFKSRFSMPIEWAIILAIAVTDAILLAETSFRLDASSLLGILPWLIVIAGLFLLSQRNHFKRVFPGFAPRITHLAKTALAMVLFTYAFSILSFILTGILPLPNWDEALAAADHSLGLNWLDVYRWLARYPSIEANARAIYLSLGMEIVILFIALELLGHHSEARAFLLWFMVSAVAAVGIGFLMPATGTFVYYHLPIAATTAYVSQMADLRNGTLRNINPSDYAGLVQFPSWHATLAILCAYVAMPLRIFKIPLLVLNILIILSTPTVGGHYFIDIVAGIILAPLAIGLSGYLLLATEKMERLVA